MGSRPRRTTTTRRREKRQERRAQSEERREERREKREDRREKRPPKRPPMVATYGKFEVTSANSDLRNEQQREKREESREKREETREKTEDRPQEAARGPEMRPPEGDQPFSTPYRPTKKKTVKRLQQVFSQGYLIFSPDGSRWRPQSEKGGCSLRCLANRLLKVLVLPMENKHLSKTALLHPEMVGIVF